MGALQHVDLADEDAKFQAYLSARGWRGQVGADGEEHGVVGDGEISVISAADDRKLDGEVAERERV